MVAEKHIDHEEEIRTWCYDMCLKHGVSHWFFVDRLVRLNPQTKEDASKCMDWMLFHAFHFHYEEMYAIPKVLYEI